MLIIGLTGGIGSGKTVASDYLADKGIDVVDADRVAREIVAAGEPALDAIRRHFGEAVILPDGTLDRPALRARVFADPQQRAALEAITHPAIRERILQHLQAGSSPYILLVSPLLFETGQASFCQRTLVIDVDEATQRTRASSRDGVSAAQIDSIIAAQLPREERLKRADDIVVNHGVREDLYLQLDDLHRRYLDMAAGMNHV
jgi:dephospho-CoA kinase